MSNTSLCLVSPTSTVCNQTGCEAHIIAGRGYCSAHGGEFRLRRELGVLAAQERRFEREERERQAAERAKRPQFTERGDRRGVVAPGQGLSRFKKKPLPPTPPAQ